MAMTTAERTKRKEERKKAAGLVRFADWISPDDLADFKAWAALSREKKLVEIHDKKEFCNE